MSSFSSSSDDPISDVFVDVVLLDETLLRSLFIISIGLIVKLVGQLLFRFIVFEMPFWIV